MLASYRINVLLAAVLVAGGVSCGHSDTYYNGPWDGFNGYGNCYGGKGVFGATYDLSIADDFILPADSYLERYTIWGVTFGITPNGVYKARLRVHDIGSQWNQDGPKEESLIGNALWGLEVEISATNLGPDPYFGLFEMRFDAQNLHIPLPGKRLYYSLQPILDDWNYQEVSNRQANLYSPGEVYTRSLDAYGSWRYEHVGADTEGVWEIEYTPVPEPTLCGPAGLIGFISLLTKPQKRGAQ